jgi:hypothetical protein
MSTYTLSGEQLQGTWAKHLKDNGIKISQWHMLSPATQKAWNVLAESIALDVMRFFPLTLGKEDKSNVNDDKLSWMLGHLSDAEKQKIYKLLFGMGYRIR